MSAVPLLLLLVLGAANAVPFVPRELLGAEPAYGAPADDPVPYENYEVPPGQAFHFAFQMPQLDLSQIFKPLRVFAGVNMPAVLQQVEEEQRDCDVSKFDLSEEESDAIEECQEQERELEDKAALKQCIVSNLPESALELREFLDREEFGLASLSSSYSLSLVDGNFGEKRTMTFRLCPKDEINSIDEEEEPEEPINRVDSFAGPPMMPVAPIALVPPVVPPVVPLSAAPGVPAEQTPGRPVFQFGFPQIQFPDFSGLFEPFEQLLEALPGGTEVEEFEEEPEEKPMESQEEPEEASQFSSGNPFIDFFSMFYPSPGPDVDVNDCTNRRFQVSREVYDISNECKHADEYRQCLRDRVPADEENAAFLEFTTDTEHNIVGSSFSTSTLTVDDKAVVKNSIYLKRCRLIKNETEELSPDSESGEDSDSNADERIDAIEAFEEEKEEEEPPTVPEVPENEQMVESEAAMEVPAPEVPEAAEETVPKKATAIPETSIAASEVEESPVDLEEEEVPAESPEDEEEPSAVTSAPDTSADEEKVPPSPAGEASTTEATQVDAHSNEAEKATKDTTASKETVDESPMSSVALLEESVEVKETNDDSSKITEGSSGEKEVSDDSLENSESSELKTVDADVSLDASSEASYLSQEEVSPDATELLPEVPYSAVESKDVTSSIDALKAEDSSEIKESEEQKAQKP